MYQFLLCLLNNTKFLSDENVGSMLKFVCTPTTIKYVGMCYKRVASTLYTIYNKKVNKLRNALGLGNNEEMKENC